MRHHLVLFALVGFASAGTNPAWKDNTEYAYLINGRVLTSLHELADHYAGIFLKATLHIAPYPDGNLQARVTDAQYAQIHARLPDSWSTKVPESQLKYNELNLSNKPFQIIMENGLIKSLVVEKEMTNWEANLIKSIVSQFQLDIEGKNAVYSPMNNLPSNNQLEGVFKTMEKTITGEIETLYEMHRMPEYLIQSQPWLLPKPELNEEGLIIEVIKNKNYTNSDEKPVYHYGFGELYTGEPTSNKAGGIISRQSDSRLILTGKLSKFTIQHAQTFNKIIVNPTLNAREHGSVVSTLNATLYEVKPRTKELEELLNPVNIGDLVYTYGSPFTQSNEVRQKQEGPSFMEESSEETLEEPEQRFRRSTDQLIYKMQQNDKSSAESMQYQLRPSMGRAPEYPLLPYFMGYHGKSIKTNSAFNTSVGKIVKEISEDLPNPEETLARSTLSKYAILCSLVRIMDNEEINDVAQQLYTQSKKGPEHVMWAAFRDAVAEAGTGPAFLNIYKWIESHRIEKQEAAEVVASMALAVRVPTEEYMLKFFELINSPRVLNQEYLNETTILSFTRLVNRVFVNRHESYNQYPVHSFRSFYTKEGKEFVKAIVLPYLTQQLHNAVSNADSRKIHVYIRALGNVGHKQILEAFEPYLEGQKQASQFQRMLMVLSMDKIVISDPEVARSVLYRIYSNNGECSEVRVAAVYQLMRTVPPYEMMQRMAENTNNERQEEVNAAVKTAIEFASQLSSPASEKLRRLAESAKPLLTKKVYGKQQSLNLLQDFVVENMDVQFKHNLLQVGSVDHILPKGVKYSVRGNINGMKHYFFNTQAMISSIKELTSVFYQQTEEYYQKSQHQSDSHQWSSAKIAESLNLRTNEREQLEGYIYSEIESLQRIWSFDNHTIELLPQVIKEQEKMLKNGKEFSYVKFKQLKELALSYPTELGFPFLFTYDMPCLAHFEGNIKAIANPEISKNNKLNIPRHIFGEINAVVTVGTKVQSHLSIVTPFDHQTYMSGFDKNIQAHFPLTGKVNIDLDNQRPHVKLEFDVKENHKNAILLHYSSWPYTSRSDIMSFEPVALRPNTRRIRPEGNTHSSFDFIVGKKQTGMSFRVWGHHPKQSFNLHQLASLLRSEGIATLWQQIWDKSSLEQTDVSIAFIPDQSTTKKVVVNLKYQNEYRKQADNVTGRGFWDYVWPSKKPQHQSDDTKNEIKEHWTVNQLSSTNERDTKKRQEKIMTYISAGIKNAKLYFFDASVEFQGDRTHEHTFTVAAAKSNVAPQSRFVIFYENNAERPTVFALQIKGYASNTNELDPRYSLKMDPTAKYDVMLEYGENELRSSKVRAKVNFARSSSRKQYLEKTPLYEVCKKQMQEGDRQLSACQNMTIESNFFDYIQVELHYSNFRKGCAQAIDHMFKGIRAWQYPMYNIRTIQAENQDKIDLIIQYEPEHLRQVNITVKTNEEETKFYNLSVCEMAKAVLVPHPVLHLKARVLGQFVVEKNVKPTCILDNKSAQTFSNWTYPLSLSKGWTVMMLYLPQEALLRGEVHSNSGKQLKVQPENFAVLVRELSAGHREIKITFTNPESDGKTMEVTIKSKKQGSMPPAAVFVNGKEVNFDDHQAASLFNGFVEIYALPNGEVKLEIQNRFYVVYDGNRVKLASTSDKLRDSIIGLCGRFSGDKYEDFWTPNNCIVRSAKRFVESFAVEDPKQKQEMQYLECIPKDLPLYANVISDYDVDRRKSENPALRSGYIKKDGEICFTIYPVPVCKNPARTIIQDVPVHCITDSKAAGYLVDQIEKGINPDFSQKSQTRTVELPIPQQCQ